MSADSQPPSLQAQLDAQKAEFLSTIPRVVGSFLLQTTADLVRSGIAERALRPGETAPDFVLPDPTGRSWLLSTLRASGPVVLTFYRGVW